MFVYRCRTDSHPSTYPTYCTSLDDASYWAKSLGCLYEGATVEKIPVALDLLSVVQTLNGVPQADGIAVQAWGVTMRGELAEMTDEALQDFNEENPQ